MKTTYPLLANRLVYVIQGGGAAAPSFRVRASKDDMLPGFLDEKIDSTLRVFNGKLGLSGSVFDNFNTELAQIKLTQEGLSTQFVSFDDNYSTFVSRFEQTAKGFAQTVFAQEIDKYDGTLTEKFSTREHTADLIKDFVSETTFDQYKNIVSENYSTREQTATLISDQVYAAVYDPTTGVRSEMFSAINQTAAGIEMMVQEKLYGDAGIAQDFLSKINQESTLLTTAYLDAIAQNSDSLIATFDSRITQTSSSILSEVEGQITAVKDGIETDIVSYKTSIDQQVNSITATVQSNYSELSGIIDPALIDIYNLEQSSLNFETRVAVLENGIDLSVFTNGQLNAGILIERVNLYEGLIKIAADKIQIDGSTTFADGYNPYAIQAELAQYKADNDAAVSGLQSVFIALDEDQQALYQDLQSQGEQIVLLDGNISAVVDETGQLSSNYGVLHGQVVDITNIVSGHNSSITTLNGSVTDINTTVNNINNTVSDILSDVTQLNTDFSDVQGDITEINIFNSGLLQKINSLADKRNTRYVSATEPVAPDEGFVIGDEWVKETEITGDETTYQYDSYMWLGSSWEVNKTVIDGARITTGIIDAARIIAKDLFAQEIGAVKLSVVEGHVGGFVINNTLTAEDEQGRGITLDPTNKEISLRAFEEGYGVSQIVIKANTLTPEAELNSSGGLGFRATAPSSEFNIRKSGSYINSNDTRATAGFSFTTYVGKGTGDIPAIYTSSPGASSRIVIQPGKSYTADLPYTLSIYHSGASRNGRHHKLHGDLVVKVTSMLIGVTASGSTKTLVSNSLMQTEITRSTRETAAFHRTITRKSSFYSQDCVSAYWILEINLKGDLTYQQWTSQLFGHYWMTSESMGIDYRCSIPSSFSLDASLGIMEIATSGLQFMWSDTRSFRIDGKHQDHFIESKGKWVHDGDFQLNGSDIVTIDNVSSAIESDLSAYATRNYVDTGFYTMLQSDDRYAKKAGDITQDFHVKDLHIAGQVNQWLAQQLVVDDARIQVNRKQDGVTVDSGLVIYDKDTSSEVSSLVYDKNGVWKFDKDLRIGGGGTRNLYTGSMRIRDTGTGAWIISPESGAPARWYFRPDGDTTDTNGFFIGQGGVGFGTVSPQERLHVVGDGRFEGNVTLRGDSNTLALYYNSDGVAKSRVNEIILGREPDFHKWRILNQSTSAYGNNPNLSFQYLGATGSVYTDVITMTYNRNVGINQDNPTERLHVDGNGRFTGNILATGNVRIGAASQSGGYVTKGYIQTFGGGGTGGGFSGIEFNTGAWSHTGVLALYTSNGATSTRHNGLVVDNGGNVAIKKSTGAITADSMPSEALDVTGNALITGNVTAGGNVGTSNFVSQMQGWRVTPQGQADFRHIYTGELQAKAFTADISQALVGSDVLTKSVAKLAQNWATTANGATSSIYVEELEGFPGLQVFAAGDRLLLRLFDRSGGGLLIKNIWATVDGHRATAKNVQRYDITVNSGGATGQTVYAGSMILDYGTPGSGVIERTVLDQQGSPYSRVSTWVSNPWTPANYTLHYQSGNLNGIANASGWGVYSENSFLTGKLLVGDLTKAGQFMEYKSGVLAVKGRIEAISGFIGGSYIESGAVGHNADNDKFIGMVSQTASNATIGGANSYLRRGFGIYHLDSATTPGGFKAMRMGMLSNSNSATAFPSTPEYGFQIRLAATANDVFRVDSKGAFIAGITFDDSKLSTRNWWLNKDGSFYFGAGGVIEGGLITGAIESSNFNGTVGSRFDLRNGNLLIGDAIWISGDTREIHVLNRDTGLDSFRIGDFQLTPTDFAGAGVDVLLGSSVITASPASGSYQLNRTVYVTSSGALSTSTSYISNSLIDGGIYSFQASLKVTLSQHWQLMDTILGYLTGEGFRYRGGNGIKIQLKNDNTVVWEKNVTTIPNDGVIPLTISTSFQATSWALRLIVTIDGEYECRVHDGANTRFYGTTASISRLNSSSRLVLQALLARMEFSTKGMQAVFSSTNYFRCDSNEIRARAAQTYISPNGRYQLRVSNNGIEKSTNYGVAGSWTAL